MFMVMMIKRVSITYRDTVRSAETWCGLPDAKFGDAIGDDVEPAGEC